MYSLVNVATLCRDLARHPNGAAVADDLLHVFALDDVRLEALDAERWAPAWAALRPMVRAQMSAQPRAPEVLAAARNAADVNGREAWTAAVDLLERTLIGDFGDLLRFTQDEVLEHAWARTTGLVVARWPHALEVVGDGIAASYASASLPIAVTLGHAWRHWRNRTGLASAPVCEPAVADIVARVGSADANALDRAADALRDARAAGWSWAAAMHDACWAVELTNRRRSTAVAQLHALRAVLSTAARPRPAAVAAVVAAVHATAVADVLPGPSVAAMTAPLAAHLP